VTHHFLFVVTPYIAVLAAVPVGIVRYVLRRGQPEHASIEVTTGGRSGLMDAACCTAIALVALGHLLAFAFPDYVLLWNRQPSRLFVLEGLGVIAGSLALAGLLATLMPALRASGQRGAPSLLDVIAGTLALIAVTSGIAIAVFYRWASIWSGVTLVPYLHSLLRLEPSTSLITRLPFLVRLHVFCAFDLLAVAPFSRPGLLLGARCDRVTRRTLAPVSHLIRPVWCAVQEWSTKRVQMLRAAVLRNTEEEN
jgi:nitrate reductase gamma subunit